MHFRRERIAEFAVQIAQRAGNVGQNIVVRHFSALDKIIKISAPKAVNVRFGNLRKINYGIRNSQVFVTHRKHRTENYVKITHGNHLLRFLRKPNALSDFHAAKDLDAVTITCFRFSGILEGIENGGKSIGLLAVFVIKVVGNRKSGKSFLQSNFA